MIGYEARDKTRSTWLDFIVKIGFLGLLVPIVLGGIVSKLRERPKSRRDPVATQIGSFKSSLQLYMLDNGDRPPNTAQGLDALINKPTFGPLPKKWQKYLTDVNAIPKDPWGNDYVYTAPGPNGEPFLIVSYGADGKPGGQGDDEDITSSR